MCEREINAPPVVEKPLPVEVAAVWGAFLFEGLFVSTLNTGRASEILDRWGNGCIELVAEACSHLPELWAQAEPHWHAGESFPGIFEYEVVSELGSVMGDHVLQHGYLPSEQEVESTVTRLLKEFFRDYLETPASQRAATPA